MIGTRVALLATRMNIESCLRAEVEKVWAVMDEVAPGAARPESWVSRAIAFLSGMVL